MARFNLKLCITGFNSRDYYVNIRKEMLASCRWPIWSGQDIYLTMKNNQCVLERLYKKREKEKEEAKSRK
ncbi:hypothetical protein JHK87_033401 [Glycine soja]|nr:hypothetical protein JHK87_033401 [Glycine soja]